MLLILSRLALKHDLEVRELQDHLPHDAGKARRTFDAGEQSGHGTLRDQTEGGTAATGRAARLRMGGRDDGFDYGHSTLRGRQSESGGIHTSSANSPETLLQSTYWSQFKRHEGLGQVAVFRGPPDSAHLVPHHRSHESEGRQRVRPGSSGGQRSRTPANARRSIPQAGDKKGGQQSLTSSLRPKTTSTAQSSTGDSGGGQRQLTSWMRPKSSPAPAVYAAPVLVVEYIYPASEVCAATVPVVENISPAPAATCAETVPVMECISPAPAGYTAPAALVEYVCPAPAASIAEPAPTVCAAHDAVVEYISPATAMSLAAPTPVQYATLMKQTTPEQYDAPMMTVHGVDLNRDGISNVLQQRQLGIFRLFGMEDQ